MNLHQILCLSWNIAPQKVLGWFRKPQLWAMGDGQRRHNNLSAQASCESHAEIFGGTSEHPGDSGPLQPRFGTL